MTTKTLQGNKKKGKFQAIPSKQPSDPVASAIAENIEMLTGQRGHGGKKAVLWEDLEELKLASISQSGRIKSLIDPSLTGKSGGNGGGGTTVTPVKPVVETPTLPKHVQINNGFGLTTLTWDTPTYKGHAYTEIFQATKDDFTQAVRIDTTSANIRSIPLSMSGDYYFWIRFVNVSGSVGPIQSTFGLHGKSVTDPQYFLDIIQDRLNPDLFAFADIATVDELDRLIAEGVIENAVTEDVQNTHRRTEHLSLKATIETKYYTIVDNDKAIAAAIQTLKSEIEDDNGSSIAATLTNNYQTKTTTNKAIASAKQELKSEIDNVKGSVSTMSQTVADINGVKSLWEVKAKAGDLIASVGLVAESNSKTGVRDANFVVKNSNFQVVYDREYGAGKGTEAVPVFGTTKNPAWDEWKALVDQNKTAPDEPIKYILAINTTYIKVANIRELVAGDVIADKIVANTEIKSPKLITPRINDKNSNFFVDESGFLTAQNAYIRGRIVATSGEFPVSLLTGKLTANQVVAEDFVLKGQTLTAAKSMRGGAVLAGTNKIILGTLKLDGIVKASNYLTNLIVSYTGTIYNPHRLSSRYNAKYRPGGLPENSYIKVEISVDGGPWTNIGSSFKLSVQSRQTGRVWVGGGDSGNWSINYEFWYSEGQVYISTTIPGAGFGKNNSFRVVSTTGFYSITNQNLTVNLGRR
ncbi:hypothetical protein [Vibrio splendidus]|uniref:hypothetical protein n=1 Tax=Vibrio splendidus TaxID=29497 RepID=UPI00076A28E6|nr:hypothetical protein [Vibrio splendidus]PHX05507.1 hypothetical protein VSPL_29010 [Vibrio splendidus]